MAKRAAYTILFIKSDRIARADFGPAPQLVPLGFWEQPQTANARLYYSIKATLELGGKCGRSVWVVSEGFWTQTLSLPATALGGLSRDQIAKAIGFDVETLTGLSGADSALGFCKAAPSDELEHLWVTQVPLTARTQIQSAVEAAGGALAGIIHPGGLPAPLEMTFEARSATRTWRRIEVWKDATLCLTGTGGDVQRMAIINGDPAQDAWRSSVARWMNLNNAEHSEWLGPQAPSMGDPLRDPMSSWASLPLLTDEALKGWLAQWASKLLNRDGAVVAPIIGPNRANTLRRQQLVATIAITLLCLSLCFLRGAWIGIQRASLAQQQSLLGKERAKKTAQLKNLESPKRRFDELQQQIKTLRPELDSLKTARSRMQFHSAPDFELQRRRVDELLLALARHANPDFIIDRITPQTNGEMLIEGKCLPGAGVDDFSGELSTVLPSVGWNISPADKSPAGTVPGGQFTLRVTPSPSKTPDETGVAAPATSLVRGGK